MVGLPLLGLPARAQQGGGGAGGGYLLPPSLPGNLPATLPGGMALPGLPAGAQQDILQRILDAGAQRPPGATLPGQAGPAWPPQAAAPAAPVVEEPLSPAEAFFAGRALATEPPRTIPPSGRPAEPPPPLRLFGIETLRSQPGAPPPPPGFGTLPEDYLIGRDDEVVLAFRGRVRQTLSLRVGRDGMLLLPDLAPIPAAGRTLRELRADLEGRAARELGGSEVFVSIGQVRQTGIFVGGEVLRPGLQQLTAMASVLDALMAAGGVKRTGSLRAIRIEGPQGRRVVDLYPVLAGEGDAPDLRLREGERILVPPLGSVVAVGGEVMRPGIYELPAGAAQAPLAAVLRLAGEPMRPTGNRFLLQTTDAEGRRSWREMGPRDLLRRGDALLVQPGSDVLAQQIRLAGHVGAPLVRAAGGRGQTLRGLLGDPRLVRPDPYVRLGLVWRTDARTRARRFLAFDLGRVLQGQADMPLAEGDEVILLGLGDVLFLASPTVQQALRGDAPLPGALQMGALQMGALQMGPTQTGAMQMGATPSGLPAITGMPGQALAAGAAAGNMPPAAAAVLGDPALDCQALVLLTVAAQSSRQRFAHARSAGFPDFGRQPCPPLFLEYPTLLPFLIDHSVLLTGEVRLPGLYPILDDTGMDAVLAAAGGATDTADLSTIEFSREPAEQNGTLPLSRTVLDLRSRNFAAVRLSPRDGLRLPRGFGDRDIGPVTLSGEFVRPGIYDIRRGERLSEVMARAGGLTPQAYPYGAVFTRESVRDRQQDGFNRSAREMEQGLMQVAAGQAVAGMRGSADLGGAILAGQQLAQSLRQARAAGRMVVESNPVVLAGRPDLDVLLEPGDLIAMPKRPNEVTVVGAVLNPGSLQFATGWRSGDYVRAAGGEQRFADGRRAFVVLPNGQSSPAGLGAWQAGGPPIPPGSTVVVPQDPSPYETWGLLRDITQVLSQVALSSAALAVIVRTGGR